MKKVWSYISDRVLIIVVVVLLAAWALTCMVNPTLPTPVSVVLNAQSDWDARKKEYASKNGMHVERLRMPDGSYEQVTMWLEDGVLHRVHGPAAVSANSEIWFFKGKYHREDGPAMRYNGDLAYFKHGVLHRVDGPAVILSDGTEYWYMDGVLTIPPVLR
jgi:hypothetical protein